MKWRIKHAFWTVIHDILAHPLAGIAWAINTSATNRFGYWLHDLTIPSFWQRNERGVRVEAEKNR